MTQYFRNCAGFLVVHIIAISSVFSQQGQSSRLAQQHLESGLQFYNQGQYKQALNDFQIIISSMSETEYADNALLRIGQYYLDVEVNLEEAKENFESVIKTYPTGDAAPGAYYYLGEVIFRSARTENSIDDALANFQRVFLYESNPWTPAALYSTGRAFERQRKFQEAIDVYFQVVVDHAQSIWSAGAQLGVGRSMVFQGAPVKAMVQFQATRNNYPDMPEAESALDWLTFLYRFYGAPMHGKKVAFKKDPMFKAVLGEKYKDVKALRVSASGVHLLERGKDRVVTFDRNGVFVDTKNAIDPYGLSIDPRGGLVVATEKGIVLDGVFKRLSVPLQNGSKPLDKIRWAVRDRLGDIFVYDDKQKKILRFDSKQKLVGPFPDSASREILAIEIDERSNLVVLEKKKRDVLIYSSEGRVIKKIPTVKGELNFKKAVDIALDPAGYLYILDEGRPQIAVFDPAYQHIANLTDQSLGAGFLDKPKTMDVDSSGDLYVYDDKSKTVVRLH